MQNDGKFKRLKHPEVDEIHLTFLNILVCRPYCLKYLAYLICSKSIDTQKISGFQGLFPLHQKRPWERGWDGGSSISRGRAHIHIFVFTDLKKNRSRKKSTLQNTNTL